MIWSFKPEEDLPYSASLTLALNLKQVTSKYLKERSRGPEYHSRIGQGIACKSWRKEGEMNLPQVALDREADVTQATKPHTFQLPEDFKRTGIGRSTTLHIRRDQSLGRNGRDRSVLKD